MIFFKMPRNKKKRNAQNGSDSAIDRLLSVFVGKLEPSVISMIFEEAHRDEAVATEQLLMLTDARDVAMYSQDSYMEQGLEATGGYTFPDVAAAPTVTLEPPSVEKNNKKTVLLRGLPGSGKSYLAKQLKKDGMIISADNYFIDKHGQYQYKPEKLHEAHSYAQAKARAAMKEGVSPVIIDNTNIKMWEMLPFVKSSIKHKYDIQVVEPKTWWRYVPHELAKRNKHNVSKQKIEKMLKRFDMNVTPSDLILNLESSMGRSRSKSADRIRPQNEPTNLFFSNSVDYSHLRNGCTFEVPGNVHVEVAGNGTVSVEASDYLPEDSTVFNEPGIDDMLDQLFTQTLENSKRNSCKQVTYEEDDVPQLIELDDTGLGGSEGFENNSKETFAQGVYINNVNLQHSEMVIPSAKNELSTEPFFSMPNELDVKGNSERQFLPEDSELKVESIESSNSEWLDSPSRGNRRHRPNRFLPKETNGELQWTEGNKDAWTSDKEQEEYIISRINNQNTNFPEGPHAIDQEQPKPRRDFQKDQVEDAEIFWDTCESTDKEPTSAKDPKNTSSDHNLSLDDSSIIYHSGASFLSPDSDTGIHVPAHKSSKKKSKKGSRLAAKFDNDWILEKSLPKEPVTETKKIESQPDVTKVHCETMTEVQDFKIATAATSGKALEGVNVMPAVGHRFIPASLVEGFVSLNKSCSAQLDEDQAEAGESSVELLQKLFPDCHRDLIAGFLKDCQDNVSWAVNLLLDSGYSLRGEEVTFTLDETEASKVLKESLPCPSEDFASKKENFPNSDDTQKEHEELDSTSKMVLPQTDVAESDAGSKDVEPQQTDTVKEEMEAIESTFTEQDILKEFEAINSALKEMLPELGLAEEEVEPVDPSLKEILLEAELLQKLQKAYSRLSKISPKTDEVDDALQAVERNSAITPDGENSPEPDDGCPGQNSDSPESLTSGDVSFPTVIENSIKDRTVSPDNCFEEMEESSIKTQLLNKVVLDPKSMSDHRRRVAVRNKKTLSEQPGDSSSSCSSGSEDSSGTAVLTMNTLFAKQLAQNYGSPLFGLGIDEFSTSDLQVNLPAELCEQIYNCWEITLCQKTSTQMKELERIIKEDEGKKSTPVATTAGVGTGAESMKEIMDLETALQKSLMDQDNSQTAMQNAKTYAATLATNKLQERFPKIDSQTLQQVFSSNDDDYMRTVQMLMSGASSQEDDRDPNEVMLNPTPEDFRAESSFYHRLRNETYEKAREAHDKKMYEVATFYAKQGQAIEEKVREANRRAAESILIHNNANQPRNTLDLHHLYVDNALEVLSQWLDQKDQSNSKYVYIVTGWGKHSHPAREPKLRPAVMKYLTDHQYRFQENNKGKFRVKTKQLNHTARC